MEHSKLLKFEFLVRELNGTEMAKKILFALLNKSELLTISVHYLVPDEDKDDLKKLLDNETFKKCFANFETNFKFDFFSNNQGKKIIMLSNVDHLGSSLLSQKEVFEVNLSKDPYFGF